MSDQESDLEFGFGYAAQLEDRIVKLQDENTSLRGENLCDACAGAGEPISGKPCMCGGSGKMSDAAIYLRSKLIDAEEENARLRAALEKSDEVVLHMQWCRECAEELPCAQVRNDVAAIAARAGVTK